MKALKFQLLDSDTKIPSFAHEDDAGFDIFSNEDVVIHKGKIYGVATGISSEIPKGYFVSIREKSGLAIKNGIGVLGGIIDAGYRGEWKVILTNLGTESFKIEKGDKIAQGILEKSEKFKIVKSKSLSTSARGNGGFGSTGRK